MVKDAPGLTTILEREIVTSEPILTFDPGKTRKQSQQKGTLFSNGEFSSFLIIPCDSCFHHF